MRAIAQFTIVNLCDVITSDEAPENPYIGMLWVNTATVPPETMVWDGTDALQIVVTAFASTAIPNAKDKPTFRFGTKWESKNAEIWD